MQILDVDRGVLLANGPLGVPNTQDEPGAERRGRVLRFPLGGTINAADELRMTGRVVKAGQAVGRALVSREPIGFLGGVDPDTGLVVEPGHSLEGERVAGRVLVFPTGKGSTVGSYTLYRLARNQLAPAAIVNGEADPVVAVGAVIADIPMVDQVDISRIRTGDWVEIRENGLLLVSVT